MTPEELYVALGRLIEAQPTRNEAEVQRWIGRAHAIAKQAGTGINMDAIEISAIASTATEGGLERAVSKTNSVLYRLLGELELQVPSAVQGSFIAVGNAFDAMVAVGKVLATASATIRIVDPYMDEKVLSDFVLLAQESVAIELLSDAKTVWASFRPGLERFKQQYGQIRPIEARLAPERSLHDRLIIIDSKSVHLLTQSLKDLAARSPASIVRLDGDTVPLKLAAYNELWSSATPMI